MDVDCEKVDNREKAQIEEPMETEDAFNRVAAEVNSVQPPLEIFCDVYQLCVRTK